MKVLEYFRVIHTGQTANTSKQDPCFKTKQNNYNYFTQGWDKEKFISHETKVFLLL